MRGMKDGAELQMQFGRTTDAVIPQTFLPNYPQADVFPPNMSDE